jgi:hypothetical protein
MKNLKGAIPPVREEDVSSSGYFYGLGFALIVISLVVSLLNIILFFSGIAPTGYVYKEGTTLLNPQMFMFIEVMSVVMLAVGAVLVAISQKMAGPGQGVRLPHSSAQSVRDEARKYAEEEKDEEEDEDDDDEEDTSIDDVNADNDEIDIDTGNGVNEPDDEDT